MNDVEIDPKENEKGGEIARKGLLRQDVYLIDRLIKAIRDDKFICAYCEHHEDYIIVTNNFVDIVQVKTKNDDSEDWSTDSNFRKKVLHKFYEIDSKITTDKQKRFYFETNCSLKKKLQDLFKIINKDEVERDEKEVEFLEKFIDQSMTSLKKLDPDKERLTEIILSLKFRRKEELESGLKVNKYLIQEILKPAIVNIDLADRIHAQLINLVSMASVGISGITFESLFEILNDSTMNDVSKEDKINQIQKCITRKKILESINFENTPFDSEIIYKSPDNLMKFQREMLNAKIPETMVKSAGVEFFNIDYHRKRIEALLKDLGKKYIDGTKAQILSLWSDCYMGELEGDEEKFGTDVYRKSREEISSGIEKKEITNPVLHKKIHALGLLHELAEEEEVKYSKT